MSSNIKVNLRSLVLSVFLVGVSIFLTYYIAPRTYRSFFCEYISSCGGGWVDYGQILWIVALYNVFVTLLVVTFGGSLRYLWLVIAHAQLFFLILYLTIPSALNAMGTGDLLMPFYMLGAWGIYIAVGFGGGWFLHKTLQKLAPSFMAKIS